MLATRASLVAAWPAAAFQRQLWRKGTPCATRSWHTTRSACVVGAREELGVALADGRLKLGSAVIKICEQEYRVVSPMDADAVMDWYIDRDMQDRDPYWAVLWASAVAMSELLSEEPHLVRGKRVAEIGCGLGLAGVAAALAGASELVFMDREACALQCALLTAAASGLTNVAPAAAFSESPIEAAGLLAFQERVRCAATTASSSECVVRASPFDWNLPAQETGFDVIIACDVLYEDFSVSPLSRVIPELFGRGGQNKHLLLTDPPHRAPSNRVRFVDALVSASPDFKLERRKVVQTNEPSLTGEVMIVVMSKRAGTTVGLPLALIS